MSVITFDAFEYARQLREVGFTEQQAEVFAKNAVQIIKIAKESAKEDVHSGDLATKRDINEVESALKRDLNEFELQITRQIEKSKNATLLWMFAMLSGVAGVMATGFHWF